jgi:SAM-dependent methyltransferase
MDIVSPANVIADEEFMPFADDSFDLITSTLNLHSVNDLPGALLQIKKSLKSDGLFLASLFGGETLFELRECLAAAEIELKGGISPRVFPFADKQQLGALLQRAGFNLPVVDSEIITVTYENIFGLLKDLRGMGERNIIRDRHRQNPGKALYMRAAEIYAQKYSEPDGRIRASFEIIFLLGWSPHESQQKPLRPGSATKRLSEALGAQEIKTGEKAAP